MDPDRRGPGGRSPLRVTADTRETGDRGRQQGVMADTGDGGCRGGYVETGQMCRRRSPGQSLVLGLNSQAPLPRRGSVWPPGHLKQATCLPSQPYFSPKTHTRSLSLCKEFDTVYKYPEGRSRRASPGFPGKSQGVQAEDASRGCRSCSGPRNEVLSSGQGWLQGGLQRYRPGAESPGLTATPGICPLAGSVPRDEFLNPSVSLSEKLAQEFPWWLSG